MRWKYEVLILTSLTLMCTEARAQWVEETFNLHPGWNAIYLEAQPFPAQCEYHFNDPAIQSVWAFDDRFSPVEFITDPNALQPETPDWYFHAPPHKEAFHASTLFALEAARAYLIHATAATTLAIPGRPTLRDRDWAPNSLNFRGLHVDPNVQIRFNKYFEASPAHQGIMIYRLENDAWTSIPATTFIKAGEAYWIECKEQSDYPGPVDIRLTEGTFLDYSQNLVEHLVGFKHFGAGNRSIMVRSLPTAPVPEVPETLPDVTLEALAGEVPLEYLDYDSEDANSDRTIQFVDLPATIPFPTGETAEKQLRLAVARREMAPYDGPEPSSYQTLLEVKDGDGFRRIVGVTSKGTSRAPSKLLAEKGVTSVDPMAGLWVGTVVLNHVSEPFQSPDTLSPTPAEFILRVMVHLDASGNAKLLRRATQMWRDGTYRVTTDPQGNQVREVDTPGYYVLVTPTAPQSLLNQLVPGSLRDGRPFARRISTAAFSLRDSDGDPIDQPMILSGPFGQEGSVLSTTLMLEADDPVNPFRHRYHPDHGNNTYAIERALAITFSSEPPDSANLAGWGNTQVGGMYEETLRGLKRDPIQVEGTVRFQRASTVSVLNDGI
ncbi:MAG: hypothetical protein GHCLOJNM_02996 [bacterium]|nr:hypothetical protein [bacterium]